LQDIEPGALYLVSTPIGNLNDITFRAIYILKSVNIIATEDTRKTSILLRKYDITTKMIIYHSYNQRSITPKIINRLQDQQTVALVSEAGTPGLLDPGHDLIRKCIEENIVIIPIPGASALLPALVVSGLPTNRFVFEGFLPVKKGRKNRIMNLTDEKRTIVFYESPHRIIKTTNELYASLGNRKCVMAREMTKRFEEFFRGTLQDLILHLNSSKPKGEIVLLIEGVK
jgi:16S rRNA (cytidine1402-2'-O)-methyltransferase